MKAAQKQNTRTAQENVRELRLKAALFDELVELIEDRYFGRLMARAEKEPTLPLSKAKHALV
jgi:hypothetical protein